MAWVIGHINGGFSPTPNGKYSQTCLKEPLKELKNGELQQEIMHFLRVFMSGLNNKSDYTVIRTLHENDIHTETSVNSSDNSLAIAVASANAGIVSNASRSAPQSTRADICFLCHVIKSWRREKVWVLTNSHTQKPCRRIKVAIYNHLDHHPLQLVSVLVIRDLGDERCHFLSGLTETKRLQTKSKSNPILCWIL